MKERSRQQEVLRSKKQFELEERIVGEDWQEDAQERIVMDDLQSYRPYEPYPSQVQKGKFFLDPQALTILVPFRNQHLPFHALSIKHASVSEGRLRVHFWTNETSVNTRVFPQHAQCYIKEMVFAMEEARVQDYLLAIRDMQEEARRRFKQKAVVGELEPLILNKTCAPVIMKMMRIRPSLCSTKQMEGYLECHMNGFRYINSKSEMVDITFQNIKHFIYQSPAHEIIGAFHFHLHRSMTVGRKRTLDIQFYREVGGAIELLEHAKRNEPTDLDYDMEEGIKSERRLLVADFQRFLAEVEHFAKDDKIKFDQPIRELAFEGNWNRARLLLQPSQHCVLNVVESPFFIVTCNEVDIACFERIMPGLKSFDLVFVFKSYDKGWVRIESIDKDNLDKVQHWLTSKNILYFQVANSLMWKNMLFTISRDFNTFVQEGGWAKIMTDQLDHAPIHNYIDDGSTIFSPLSSQPPTSLTMDVPDYLEQQLPIDLTSEEEDPEAEQEGIEPPLRK